MRFHIIGNLYSIKFNYNDLDENLKKPFLEWYISKYGNNLDNINEDHINEFTYGNADLLHVKFGEFMWIPTSYRSRPEYGLAFVGINDNNCKEIYSSDEGMPPKEWYNFIKSYSNISNLDYSNICNNEIFDFILDYEYFENIWKINNN